MLENFTFPSRTVVANRWTELPHNLNTRPVITRRMWKEIEKWLMWPTITATIIRFGFTRCGRRRALTSNADLLCPWLWLKFAVDCPAGYTCRQINQPIRRETVSSYLLSSDISRTKEVKSLGRLNSRQKCLFDPECHRLLSVINLNHGYRYMHHDLLSRPPHESYSRTFAIAFCCSFKRLCYTSIHLHKLNDGKKRVPLIN